MKFIDTFKADINRLKEWSESEEKEPDYDFKDTDKILLIFGILFIIVMIIANI